MISGLNQGSLNLPDTGQDYVVAGLQPWLAGIVTAPGLARQVSIKISPNLVLIHLHSHGSLLLQNLDKVILLKNR